MPDYDPASINGSPSWIPAFAGMTARASGARGSRHTANHNLVGQTFLSVPDAPIQKGRTVMSGLPGDFCRVVGQIPPGFDAMMSGLGET